MKRSAKCPKCGGTDIIADAQVVDRGHYDARRDLSVATYRSPTAIVFKGRQETTVSAWVCGACGYIELYADSPSKLDVPPS